MSKSKTPTSLFLYGWLGGFRHKNFLMKNVFDGPDGRDIYFSPSVLIIEIQSGITCNSGEGSFGDDPERVVE